jgi:hypothetical protein
MSTPTCLLGQGGIAYADGALLKATKRVTLQSRHRNDCKEPAT